MELEDVSREVPPIGYRPFVFFPERPEENKSRLCAKARIVFFPQWLAHVVVHRPVAAIDVFHCDGRKG